MSGVLKAGYLMLGALSNTFKVPVDGYAFLKGGVSCVENWSVWFLLSRC